ncbi:MAG: glycosyl transferase family 28 [Bacteroidetes bacterium]|nr:glycosyl transferase family 28 [Bacteroidota bacterium]
MIRVKRENAWIRRWARLEQPDLIISDNRYGLYVAGIPSVFMTHQLLIRTPWGGIADRWLQRINYSFIRRFSLCWVPDVEGEGGLAGELSHPRRMPAVPVRYIGWLSRFVQGGVVTGADIDLLVLLSGPEPQRTMLEKKIMDQVADYSGRVVLVRGLPDNGDRLKVPAHVTVYDHLPAGQLEVLVRGAGRIICRPGYSTVMDLVRLGRRAIMIPTPGQTEQEYLGHYLASRGWAICVDQKGFSLADALAAARGAGSRLPDPATGEGLLQQAIADLLISVEQAIPAAGSGG